MTSVIYIVLYFGKMREDFPLWLKTCEYNPTIDWLVVTDDRTDYHYPDNVHVVATSFEQVVDRFSQLVDFPVALKTPYKLCDFKPAYGEAFSDYLEGYDFWGHCDVDLLWGDIRHFLTEDVFRDFDKIGFLGHSTLYRNTPEVNQRWRCTGCSEIDYRTAFSVEENCFFDERAMNEIYEANGWRIYKKLIFADLTEYRYNFYLTNVPPEEGPKNNKQIFYWRNGTLFRNYLFDGQVGTDTFMYIHFLKRRMQLEVDTRNREWMIVPNKITDQLEEPDYRVVKKYSRPRWGKYYTQLLIEKRKKINPASVFRFLVRRSQKYYILKHDNGNLNNYKM